MDYGFVNLKCCGITYTAASKTPKTSHNGSKTIKSQPFKSTQDSVQFSAHITNNPAKIIKTTQNAFDGIQFKAK